VIPTNEQLEEISHLAEGKLPEVSFAALLLASAVHKRTVVLEVRRKQLAKKIVFEHGLLIDCRSNLVHETLGRYMVAMGKLAERDLLPCLNQSAARGVPLGEVLIERELLGAEELYKILQQNLAQKLLDVFTWKDGEFSAVSGPPENKSPIKIRVPQLIVTGVTKSSPLDLIESEVVPLVGKRLVVSPEPRFSLDEIRLGSRYRDAVAMLHRGARLDQLATGTGLPFEEVSRLVYALSLLGVVVASETLKSPTTVATPVVNPEVEAVTPPPTGAPPAQPTLVRLGSGADTAIVPILHDIEASPPPAAPEPPPVIDAERRNAVAQAFLAHRRQDAFELLGLPEHTTLVAVEETYLQFAARFAPWQFEGQGLENIAEQARTLFLAGAHALDELTNAERRSLLLLRRATVREERRQAPVPSFHQIKTDLLDSEAQFKKGRALMELGRYREAVLQLEFASDCDPQNGQYAAELAYCRFLNSSAAANQALNELREALRRDPECGIAQYYAGEIERSLGHFEEAETFLRRAIKAMAPDRRPIQALKALAGDRKRS
jgi:hypothetical protein